jgi:hypothetical protein
MKIGHRRSFQRSCGATRRGSKTRLLAVEINNLHILKASASLPKSSYT